MSEYIDENRCTQCGGKCCKIYSHSPDGSMPRDIGFADWCCDFDLAFRESGADKIIQQQFEPLIVHMTGNEYMKTNLIKKGIDPDYCKYHSMKKGCLLPRKNRPKVCREYNCIEE